MRALSDAETRILKSRFQSGPLSGHSQQVIITAPSRGGGTIQDPYFPWVAHLSSGNAGLLFEAKPFGFGGNPFTVWFMRYSTQHVLVSPVELFPYATVAYGLVTYRDVLIAACYKPSDGSVVYRTSTNAGVSWSTEAELLPAGSYVDAEVYWAATQSGPSFQLAVDLAQTTLVLFTKNSASNVLNYRSTTAVDPTTGWSAKATTGFTIPSFRRNYGGATARNQGLQRAFVACASKTPGTWCVMAESDDGDWHANHAVFQGTLGGAWTNKLDDGYGGGLSGGQGANAMLFLDRSDDLLAYVESDDGDSATAWRSTDSGATWVSLGEQMPAGGAGQIGGGAGFTIPEYDFQEYAWGHIAGGGTAIGVSALYEPGVAAEITNWLRIVGTDSSSEYVEMTTMTADVSDRVNMISLQKDDEAASASFNIELQNTDGALNLSQVDGEGNVALLAGFAVPNAFVDIYQWYGDPANKKRTFGGIVDNPQENSVRGTIVLVGRDQGKKLLTQRVIPVAPQTLGTDGAIRDMENYVYLNKTLNEVLDNLLVHANLDSTSTGRDWAPSSYVFEELVLSSGSLMDNVKNVAALAGMRFWFDEDRIARTQNVAGPQSESAWTFRAYEDMQSFDTDLSDDNTFTRVRVVGKANIGAKYLQAQFYFASPAPDIRAIAADQFTGNVWVLCGNSHLYELDPDANMDAVAEHDLSSWLAYPSSMDVGPDGHLWIADSFNATLGPLAGRQFRKVDSTSPTTTLVGPFDNPDLLPVRLWHDQVDRLWMDTYATPSALVKMNDATGAEVSRVVSPVNFPMGFDSDGQGGAFLTGWEQTDLFQIDLAGNIVNTIQQPNKNSNELSLDHDDLGLWAVFIEENTIVKYAVAGTPTSVPVATLAEAIDAELELQLFGEIRVLDILDLSISSLAMAYATALLTLGRVRKYTTRIQQGIIGNPGLQLHDRITVAAPSQGIAAGDYMVRSIRSDQTAGDGTYLAVLGLEPYDASF